MSRLKVDSFYRFFNVFVMLIMSHNKEEIDISIRKNIFMLREVMKDILSMNIREVET